MRNVKKSGPSQQEIRECTIKAIREYVDAHNEKNERIESKKQIIDDIRTNCKEANYLSNQSLYRYLSEMNLQEIAEGKFDFVIEDNKLSLKSILHYKKYNKIVCFYIENPEYTNLITYLINQYYEAQDMSDIIYCIALEKIILCLYYYQKNVEHSITREKIKDDINQVAKAYTLYAK